MVTFPLMTKSISNSSETSIIHSSSTERRNTRRCYSPLMRTPWARYANFTILARAILSKRWSLQPRLKIYKSLCLRKARVCLNHRQVPQVLHLFFKMTLGSSTLFFTLWLWKSSLMESNLNQAISLLSKRALISMRKLYFR